MYQTLYHESKELEIYRADTSTEVLLPFASSPVSAGFPSPAEDYMEGVIDLNKEVIKNPHSTFFAKVKGVSLIGAGIYPDDILIVDREPKPKNNNIVIAYIDGEFVAKRIKIEENGYVYLMAENKDYLPIRITEDNDFLVWGVVTYIIKKAR